MTPTCAACLQPIVRPQRFLLIGTECVHRACARAGMTTQVARLQAQVADANVTIERMRREALQAGDRLATAIRHLEAAQRRRDEILERMQREQAQRVQDTITAAPPVVFTPGDRRPDPVVISTAPPPAAPHPEPAQVQSQLQDDRDDTEIRMSLLEDIPA